MKSLFLTVSLLAAVPALWAAAAFDVQEIQPPHWWTGMHDTSLQLQVFGKDVRSADVTIDYPGVRLDSVARLDGSPDWQFIYLTVTPEAKPGEMTIKWKEGKTEKKKKFELRARKPQKGAAGFDASDVLYMIMPDRFADGNPDNNLVKDMNYPIGADRTDLNVRHGGDIKGILNHVAYLDTLGITAVWVNPVLENDMPGGSYHGYATTDYYAIDPRFGTNEEYVELIDTLHGRDIKMVMDMIFNHCGVAHPWVENPPASNWFNLQDNFQQTNYRISTVTDPYATDYDKMLTVDGWFVAGMPDLNQNNPHLMKYLIQNSIFWIEEAQIDGIRMDTYPYADRDRMKEWVEAVLAAYPDFNIVGECWLGETAGEMYWQKGSALGEKYGDTGLPTIMDFPLMIKSRELKPFTIQTNSYEGLNAIYDHMALDYVYPDPMKVLRFLDNHDTERVILEVPENLDSWKQAVALVLTIPGIPQLYYGTELLMAGDRKLGDGNVRRDMPGGFPGDTSTVFTREGRSDLQNEALDFIATINQWRKGSDAIANGAMKHFMPTNGVYLYQRKAESGDEVIVVMNGVDDDNTVDMSRYTEIIDPGTRFTDILTGEEIELIPQSGNAERTFSPREIRILQRK